MSRRALRLAVLSAAALFAIGAALIVAMATSSSSSARTVAKFAAGGDPDKSIARPTAGGEAVTWEAYRAAAMAYPAESVPVQWLENANNTFARIAARSPRAPNPPPNPGLLNVWQQYGPQKYATYPGILDYGGAGYHTASRIVALAISKFCNASECTMYAGPNSGGVWKTNNALDPDPTWTMISAGPVSGTNTPFAQQTIGDIIIDPTDADESTIWVGTGEPNSCSSGCPAGVGLYKSTDYGANWSKVTGACVSNGTYVCASPGKDSFLGRGISEIVIDPLNPNHMYVGSATAVRSISHVIGLGGQVRFNEPGPNPTGLYESFNGGATFTPAWVPAPANQGLVAAPGRRGVIDIGLDPNNTAVVYASAFDKGVWRRCPPAVAACNNEAYTAGAGNQFDWRQVFAPRVPGSDVERTMFDLTTAPNNGNKTRIYLTTGRAGPGSGQQPAGESASSFWRTDNANQTSAALLATEPAPPTVPPASPGNPFGVVYNGWQILTSPSTASPYWATHNFCTGQCWYDQDVESPEGRPNEVYVIGSYLYNEMTCYTKGTNFCASGISNTRGILWSTTAGDPDPTSSPANRTFTDMTWDAQNEPAPWCAYPGVPGACLVAHNAGHPDQHEIVVNPNNTNQFFEASDGGMLRSSGTFTNLSRACFFRALADPSNAMTQCQRLLSRVPTRLSHINQNIGSTLQFINVHANPMNPCHVIGGTQDNGTWMPGGPGGQLGAGGCDADEWFLKIYGDGGNAGFDSHPDDPALPGYAQTGQPWSFNQFTSPTIDANFRGGAPEKWVVTSGPIANAEAVGFYQPQIPDPNPPLFGAARTHPVFVAQLHVWRSWAFGAGRPISVPQQVVPDVPYYETNCPEFFTAFNDPNCGDYQPMGGAGPSGDLTSSFFSGGSCSPAAAARCGGGVSWIARRGADHNTMWATTSAGRVFVTFNANDPNPAAVVWNRVDHLTQPANPCTGDEPNCSPSRVPTGIYPDPSNPRVAYISYTGYNASTPGTPGHLFRVSLTPGAGTPTGATFLNLNVENGLNAFPTNGPSPADLPVNDVVMDDATGDLYVATDFGVLKGVGPPAGPFAWSVTPGMPRYIVVHLALVGGQRDACRSDVPAASAVCGNLLYAATHSQGIWLNKLR